jgi:hypothetical protein
MTERLIAEIEKNSREQLRITLGEFKGHRLINLRVWFLAEDGKMRPGNSGVAIKIDRLEALISALLRSRGEANELGWLPPATRDAERGKLQ